jgi:hypothetical protein
MPLDYKRSTATCIIAGAGPHLGLAVAERYAREGFSVYILSRRGTMFETDIERLHLHGLRVVALECDIAQPGEVDRAIRSIELASGICDVFVYNALVESDYHIEVEDLSASLNAIVRAMHVKGGGAIVLSVCEGPGTAVMRAFARGLAKDTEAFGIRIGIVTIEGELPPLEPISPCWWSSIGSSFSRPTLPTKMTCDFRWTNCEGPIDRVNSLQSVIQSEEQVIGRAAQARTITLHYRRIAECALRNPSVDIAQQTGSQSA